MTGCLLCFAGGGGGAQDSPAAAGGTDGMPRGSIPEELLRPRRGEAPRYPVDTVIGVLGRGEASVEAYTFARQAASALTERRAGASSLSALNKVLLEGYLNALEIIDSRTYRLGSGREEKDGAVSFLVRFIGREQGITGELFIRLREQRPAAGAEAEKEGESEAPAVKVWVFEDLILEEARNRDAENDAANHRFDFAPYQRFF